MRVWQALPATMRLTHISIIHKPLDTRVFHKECRVLARAGYEVHLVVGGAPSAQVEGVHLHPISDTIARPQARRQIALMLRAARTAFRLRPSVYHLHDPHLIPLGVALKLAGADVIYDVHEDYPAHARTKLRHRPARARLKAAMWGALERLARSWFDGFVCASPSLAEKFPSARTVVVSNLPLHREFASQSNGSTLPYRHRPNTVIYTGNISRIRGFWELVAALELIPAQLDCRLRMVGELRDPDIIAAADQLCAAGKLQLAPFVPYSSVIREVLGARIGVVLLHPLPNHLDPTRSNKLFEYMAAGIPVIGPDLPRWREIICGLGCGLVVDPLDPRAIADAVGHLLGHPREAETMGRRGQAAVFSGLNWDADRARLMELYRGLMTPRPTLAAAAPA
jgi:glycosyltransferase involved in cell wall biosynthesis